MIPTIVQLQHDLKQGKTTSLTIVQAALARIQDPNGQGASTFLQYDAEQALLAAQASDLLRQAGLSRSELEGIPISIKDLFDKKGEVTKAASVVLNDAPTATQHASLIQRLLDAGAILIGRTNMTEFAFSGLGINPHYGTPHSPWDRPAKRIPGGSSSGAAVSVAEQMAVAAVGTDTGGSIRIPAAFCGLTGFKPTAARIPTHGVMPLSESLDSSGPIAASVECCAIVDAVLSGQPYRRPTSLAAQQLRFILPTTMVLDEMDDTVRQGFELAIKTLQDAGAQVAKLPIPEFSELPYLNRLGGVVCAEAWVHHRERLTQNEAAYDPRVASRIRRGQEQDVADYVHLQQRRQQWIAAVVAQLAPYDAMLLPTVPIVAPTIASLRDEDAYFAANGLILRNPSIINFLDGCAFSLPCHREGDAPVGLMLAAPALQDKHLINVAYSVEQLLRPLR